MRLTRLHLVPGPFHGQAEGGGVDLQLCDPCTEHRLVQAAVVIHADRSGRHLTQRSATADLAHGPDHGPLMRQQMFGHVPAAVQRPDEVGLLHPHVVEEGLAERALAADQGDRPGRHALGGHVEQDKRNAQMLRCLRIGPHQAEDPVGLVGVAGPDLLAVDDPVVTLVFRPRLDRRQIGPRARLGIALAPANLPAHDLGQEALLLFLGPEGQQGRAQHPDPETGQRRLGVDSAHLGVQHLRLFAAQPAAAVFGRPFRRGPAALAHPVQPDLVRRRREDGVAPAPDPVLVTLHRPAALRRTVGFQPGAGLRAERIKIGHVSLRRGRFSSDSRVT